MILRHAYGICFKCSCNAFGELQRKHVREDILRKIQKQNPSEILEYNEAIFNEAVFNEVFNDLDNQVVTFVCLDQICHLKLLKTNICRRSIMTSKKWQHF